MLTKQEIIEKSIDLGFGDIGFTNAEPLLSQKEILKDRIQDYDWVIKANTDLSKGFNPKEILPGAKSIIVLIEPYFRETFPPVLEKYFGRCYLDDDRILRKRSVRRIINFLKYLSSNGIKCDTANNMCDKLPAAKAGLGTFGRNSLFFAKNVQLGSSFIFPITIVVDQEFEPDDPSIKIGCPDWCKSACISACPTGALKRKERNYINPKICASYLTYIPDEITPLEYREPMGLYIYGCDRCQDVCPRNRPWLAKSASLPINEKVQSMIEDFDLVKLLHMDKRYYRKKIWIHMFYTAPNDLWRWKMNVARVMGNSLEVKYIPELVIAFKENKDERVKGMISWALGKLGGPEAISFLEELLNENDGLVEKEIKLALKMNNI